jgi:hypothetical protein
MDRKRIAVIAGTIAGTLALASAAGAANFGLLRAADEDPAPSVGNLDAGNGSSSSSASPSPAPSPSETRPSPAFPRAA